MLFLTQNKKTFTNQDFSGFYILNSEKKCFKILTFQQNLSESNSNGAHQNREVYNIRKLFFQHIPKFSHSRWVIFTKIELESPWLGVWENKLDI